uniref:RING-type E3 ubiquitin transferase n=1 Tax=Noccaea caerulescens TaxID=107243 RepID=A0A1J3DU32_NOCCA
MSESPDAAASHWCYHCNKRVAVETLDDFVVCCECNKGFVESIQPIPAAYSSAAASPPTLSPDLTVEDSRIGSHFLQMLRLLAHAPSQRSPPQLDVLSYEDEFFRLELNSRNEIDDEDDGNEEAEEEEEDNLTVNDEEEEEEEEGVVRMFHQPRIFPLTTRSRTGRNRILDWAEILMGIEDNSIEFRMESDRYAGNPADYVDDAAGYEALLQNLTEGDGGRRGAPPAAKSAIEALETFEVGSSEKEGEMVVVCAVCKDSMVKGETVKKLPCGHCYHGNCIVPWLGTRNSCPVCRFQLQTDDAEYEQDRKRTSTSAASSSSSASRF